MYSFCIQDCNPDEAFTPYNGDGYGGIGVAFADAIGIIHDFDDDVLRRADIEIRVDKNDSNGYATEPTVILKLDEFRRAIEA